MYIVWMIIIGFLVGLLARFLMPGRDPAGFIVTTLLGILGSVGGAFLGQALGFYAPGEPAGFLMSLLTAILILFIYKKVATRATV